MVNLGGIEVSQAQIVYVELRSVLFLIVPGFRMDPAQIITQFV